MPAVSLNFLFTQNNSKRYIYIIMIKLGINKWNQPYDLRYDVLFKTLTLVWGYQSQGYRYSSSNDINAVA